MYNTITSGSNVNVAHRSLSRAHQIGHLDRRAGSIAKVDRSVQGRVRGRWSVQEGSSTDDTLSTGTCLDVQGLPDPPSTVNHAVVEVEQGVVGRGEEVATWVASH
jgi:hypothetical protein